MSIQVFYGSSLIETFAFFEHEFHIPVKITFWHLTRQNILHSWLPKSWLYAWKTESPVASRKSYFNELLDALGRFSNNFFIYFFQRANLTDFDRFKLKRARSVRNKIRTEEYNKLLKRIYNPIRKSQMKKRAKARFLLKKKAGKAAKGKETKKTKKWALENCKNFLINKIVSNYFCDSSLFLI